MTEAATLNRLSGQTRDTDLTRKAAAMTQTLRSRATEAETLRRLPDESIKDLGEAGLFKMMLPKRVGGHQASLHQLQVMLNSCVLFQRTFHNQIT